MWNRLRGSRELKNVLSGFFFLSAFLAFLRFLQSVEHRWRFYSVSLLLFLCALGKQDIHSRAARWHFAGAVVENKSEWNDRIYCC